MFNVLLDPLPCTWNGYRLDPSFQVGIQIIQILGNNEISDREKILVAANLLFFDVPKTLRECQAGIDWFMSGWIQDRTERKKDEVPVMDFDVDQWRIYSAFLAQYKINLNHSQMHFWEFMGLLTTLDECAFTRIVDIRAKDLNGKMSSGEKAFYRKLKQRYAISVPEEAETAEDVEATEEFRRLAGLG